MRTSMIAVSICIAVAAAGCTATVAKPSTGHAHKPHKMVTVNGLGATPLRVLTSNGAMALAPEGWTMTANDRGTVDLKSADGASAAGWGGIAINRQMEAYYGKMYGAPEDSIQEIMSKAMQSTGEDGDVEYTSDAAEVGYFTERDFATSSKTGKIFYHVYGDTNSQYVESFYVCYTDTSRWNKLKSTLVNVALSIRGHVALHPAPGGEYHYTPSSASTNSGDKDDENPLKDYNAQLGTQWFHDDAGNNDNVDPDTATVDGPDGEGVYKINGNDITKLHPGFS